MNELALSYIIPALNEEYLLPEVLKSISAFTPNKLPYEIIVADNGSVDETVQIAKDEGAIVFVEEDATIGELRNMAVKRSSGKVLIFLDADISVTKLWGENILGVYERIIDQPNIVTGSKVGVPEDASWIEELWFRPLVAMEKTANYINSGHLITSRTLFDLIGGFDKSLESGEDYAFGQAALRVNADIINNNSLSAVHKGFPKTIYQFIRREMWHGRGDCKTLHNILQSKVTMAAFLFAFLHCLAIVGLVVHSSIITVIAVGLILAMCIGASIFKHGVRTIKEFFPICFLYYLYFFSRALSKISFLSERSAKRKEVD